MESFKKIIFQEEKKSLFPKYYSLDLNERKFLMDDLYSILFTPKKVNIFEWITEIASYKDFKEEETFVLKYILELFDIDLTKEVYVIWNKDSIDKFEIKQLVDYWEYIWYPKSDEAILLYFKELSSVLMLTDFGRIYNVRCVTSS